MVKRSIRIVMKSGYSFSFLCDSFKTKSVEGELHGFTYEGATANWPLFVCIENVDAIIDEGDVEETE